MSDAALEQQIALLQRSIYNLLRQHPVGISEFDLLATLEAQRQVAAVYSSDLGMFQCHFLLFHCLYRLRDELLQAGSHDVEIHCLKIAMVPMAVGQRSPLPARHDPLRDYYLDLTNLKATTEADLQNLLRQFWQRFVVDDAHLQALALFGLSASASYDEVKAQYRRLVMEHHPDRGGDKALLQQINLAMDQLKRFYRAASG